MCVCVCVVLFVYWGRCGICFNYFFLGGGVFVMFLFCFLVRVFFYRVLCLQIIKSDLINYI